MHLICCVYSINPLIGNWFSATLKRPAVLKKTDAGRLSSASTDCDRSSLKKLGTLEEAIRM